MALSYEDLVQEVGEFGRYQKMLCIVVFLCCMPNAFPTLMFIFTQATPEHRCKIPGLDNVKTLNASMKQEILRYLIPAIKEGESLDQCRRYNFSFQQITGFLNGNLTDNTTTNSIIKCDHGWVFNGPESLVTATMQLQMVCDRAWIAPLANSAIMLGMFLGSFGGKLADKYGRKNIFLISTAGQFILTGLLGLTNDVYMYVAMVVLVGTFNLVNYITLFVIGSEIVLPKHRPLLTIIPFYAFSFGYAATALFAYCLQYWRHYLLGTSLIGLLYIPTIWLIPESPRWLLAKGKIAEAKKVFENIATVNKRNVNIDELFEQGICMEKEVTNKHDKENSFLCIMTDSVMRRRLFTVFLQWFVVSIIYYVVTYGISSLASDRYWGTVIAGAMEIPSYISAVYGIKWFGSVRTYSSAMLLAAISCALIPFFKRDVLIVTTILAMIGKYGANIGFYIAYIMPTELSPTLVRGTTTSLGNAFSKLAGFIAPYFVYIGIASNMFIPYIIMNAITLLSIILTLAFIPETCNVPLPSTMEEAKRNKRIYGLYFWKSFKPEVAKKKKKKKKAAFVDEL